MPPAVLAFRDRPFEIAIVERVILDLDGQSFVVRVDGGAARDRPGFEHAVKLEPEIVMQPCGIVFLDHETAAGGPSGRSLAARLQGFLKIALGAVGRKLTLGHAHPSPAVNGIAKATLSLVQEFTRARRGLIFSRSVGAHDETFDGRVFGPPARVRPTTRQTRWCLTLCGSATK